MRFIPLLAALLLPLAPAAAQDAADPLAQAYRPAPAIWKLADADTTIYLFGTIHLLPEGFRWRSAQFDRIVREVDSLVLESSEADAMASLEAFAPKIQSVADSRRPTSERLRPELRGRWRAMIESTGRLYETVDAMPLPLALLGFDTAGQDSGASRHDLGVESVLSAEFAEMGKPVASIENHGAVMLSLMRIDDGPILHELEAELAQLPEKPAPLGVYGDGEPALEWAMEHAWARGEIDPAFDLGLGNGKIGTAFQRVLLARRNRAWARWLDDRLDQPGTILVAVGAGHFEGRQPVQLFLEARGLRMERIN